jgi:hypothetical protein
MSVTRSEIEAALCQSLPTEVVSALLDEYVSIKKQFFLKNFRPSELNAARFSECVLRLIEFLIMGSYTPFGTKLGSDKIINKAKDATQLPEGIRFYTLSLVRVLLDIRNRRNVAHTGGEVDPNYSDSLFVSHAADWIMTELVRNYHTVDIDEAREIVESINKSPIPVVVETDEFVRVQNAKLSLEKTLLLILYHKYPKSVFFYDLYTWTKHMPKSNSTSVRDCLDKLNEKSLVHPVGSSFVLLPSGIKYVEKNIPLELAI